MRLWAKIAVLVAQSGKVDGQTACGWSEAASSIRNTFVKAHNIRRFARARFQIESLKMQFVV